MLKFIKKHFIMKKLLFLLTAFIICGYSGTAQVSPILKQNLKLFADTHVTLNNKITLLLSSEKNAKFDNFPFPGLANSQNIDKFYIALANSGVVRSKELGDLIFNQVDNANKLNEKNEDFARMDNQDKKQLVSSAVEIAIIENPIQWNPADGGNYEAYRTCAGQFSVDQNRCNRNGNVQGSFAIAAFIFGPVAGGLAVLTAAITISNCLKDARADYNDCINQ
jgi:hypothetical protein